MKEKINNLLDRFYKHTFFPTLLTIAVFFAILWVVGGISKDILVHDGLQIAVGLVVGIAYIVFRKGHMFHGGLKKSGLKNLFVLLPPLLYLGVMLFDSINTYGKQLLDTKLILTALIMSLEAGICEELMVRALPLGNMLCRRETRKQYLNAAFLTAMIFALIHITNLFAGGEPLGVVVQTIGAFGLGVFFAAVYMRTGSILPTIFIHTLWDFINFLKPSTIADGKAIPVPTGLESAITQNLAGSPEGAVIAKGVVVAVSIFQCLVWICIAMFLLRKSKWDSIKANFTK